MSFPKKEMNGRKNEGGDSRKGKEKDQKTTTTKLKKKTKKN